MATALHKPGVSASTETPASQGLEKRTEESNPPKPILTGRQQQVLGLLPYGLTNKQIAKALSNQGHEVSKDTVRAHVRGLFKSLGIYSRGKAAAYAIWQGIIAPPLEASAAGYRPPTHRPIPENDFTAEKYEVLKLLANGMSNDEIAATLKTTRLYALNLVRNVIYAYGAKNRVHIMLPAAQHGIAYEPARDATAKPNVQLTEREYEVLKLVVQGDSNKQIAAEISTPDHPLKESTVRYHASEIYRKLGTGNRIETIVYVSQNGMPPKPGSHISGGLETRL